MLLRPLTALNILLSSSAKPIELFEDSLGNFRRHLVFPFLKIQKI